jgi:Kdo2-lipid IVA lauroyltransferase/acyltransferase
MEAIGYYIIFGFAWTITLLPLQLLYIFSDIFFLFIYYFPGYRRKVVRTNLSNSFPEKSPDEIKSIEKKFYHHFCDLFIETFKLLHLGNKQILERMKMTNPEVFEELYTSGRSIVLVLGHYNNWEWLVSIPLLTRLKMVSIYKPLSNKHFDRLMNHLRGRTGMILTPMSQVVREVIRMKNEKTPAMFAFITDQTPPGNELHFWTNFLNQDTPVFLGAEKIATKFNMAVVFLNIRKIKRGYYTYTAELLFDDASTVTDHGITEAHVRRLEEIIRENPENWIWSHRRWKHKRVHPDG